MVFYIDETGLSGLLQQTEGGSIFETSTSASKEDGKSLEAAVNAGGGFLSILGLAKLSLGFGKTKKKGVSDEQKFAVGPYTHLGLIIEKLRKNLGTRYFESLDDAFDGAPNRKVLGYA